MELTDLSKGREAVKSFQINLRGLEMKKRQLYFISGAADLYGLSVKRVRRYVGDDLLLEVERVIHGDRFYRHFTELNLSMLKGIKKYRDQGYYLKPAVTLARKNLGRSKGTNNTFTPLICLSPISSTDGLPRIDPGQHQKPLSPKQCRPQRRCYFDTY